MPRRYSYRRWHQHSKHSHDLGAFTTTHPPFLSVYPLPYPPTVLYAQSLTAFLGVPVDVSLVEAAECLFYHSRPSHVAALPPRGSAADTSSTEDEESQCSELRQSGRLPGGVGNAGGSVKGAAGRNRAGRGVGCEAPRQTGGEVDEVLTREHVTYTATALSFRRAQDLEPSEMRRRRGRR